MARAAERVHPRALHPTRSVLVTSTGIDPRRCPLCGSRNECGTEEGAGSCWCYEERIPEAVLDAVPDGARDLACVCRACAAGRVEASTAAAQAAESSRRRDS
jgi:hypothetical protein